MAVRASRVLLLLLQFWPEPHIVVGRLVLLGSMQQGGFYERAIVSFFAERSQAGKTGFA
jgi:hypothetical protein